MVIPYHQDLYRALEGPVDVVRREVGKFTLRHDPVHLQIALHERRVARAIRESELRMAMEADLRRQALRRENEHASS